jgi:hypothetical protein
MAISKELEDALELAQTQFESRLKQIHTRSAELDTEHTTRHRRAKMLKSFTVVCGVLVASGFTDNVSFPLAGVNATVSQLLGVGVLLIVGLERVYANFDRLVTVTAARDALERAARQAEDSFEGRQKQFQVIRDSKPVKSAEGLLSLLEEIRGKLADVIDKVEIYLRKRDAAAINKLVLEEKE